MTLTFDPLILKVHGTSRVTWTKSVRNLSEIEQSPAVTLTFDLLIFCSTSVVMQLNWFSTKFERNWIIHGWVIDDLAHLHLAILRDGHYRSVLRVAWTPTSRNLARTQGDHFYTKILFQSSDILLHFQTCAAQSWVMLKTMPNLALFDPPCEN